jgi:hypothetical protein
VPVTLSRLAAARFVLIFGIKSLFPYTPLPSGERAG